jgi:peptidoglycan/LPS O-acetylase OafA/YrhL
MPCQGIVDSFGRASARRMTHLHSGTVQGSGRLSQLEGLRGLAAMMVVAWHFVWAFAPWQLGSVAGLPTSGVVGSPVAASINGPSAVALFFVLSGFVLPLGIFRSGRIRTAVQAAAKRWLRLAGLSLVAALCSYALFRLGLFHYRETASLTGSEWLGSYGGGDPGGALVPSLMGALQEGLIGAFVHNSDAYDPVLWTMRHELLGSFVSIALVLVIWRIPQPTCGCILALCAVLAPLVDPWLIPFLVGTGLAFLVWRHGAKLGWGMTVVSIAAGFFLFGYLEPTGAYAAIPVVQDSAGYRYDRILVHTLSALLIMLGLIGNEKASRALRIGPLLLLGRLSFPIYLFHFPLLCSLACGLFFTLQRSAPYGVSLTLVALIYLPVVLIIGFLFARIDEAWAVWVNRFTDFLLTLGKQSLARVSGRMA